MRGTRIGALGCACGALLSCATMGEPAPAGPPPFLGIRSLALVRTKDDRGAARPKDPLDALQESLAGRGLRTRRIELGSGGAGDSRALDRLYAVLDGRILSSSPAPRAGRAADALGAEAAQAVRDAGVDAVATYHRYDERLLPPLPESPTLGGFGQPRRPETALRRPGGALALVDKEGNATWFPWGGVGGDLDPSQAVNAAEAIDMLLRTLAGESEEG